MSQDAQTPPVEVSTEVTASSEKQKLNAIFNQTALLLSGHAQDASFAPLPSATMSIDLRRGPGALTFSSLEPAFLSYNEYINPIIRPQVLNHTDSAPTDRLGRGAENNENAAPSPEPDLSQYINPNIHRSLPTLQSQQAAGFGVSGRRHPRPDAYKTVMCQAWLESTRCAFGDECKFAHGVSELRQPAKLPIRNAHKYKTKLCDKYTTTGICPYGNRCLFIHPDPRTSAYYRQSAIAQQIVRQNIQVQYPLEPASPPPFRPHPSWPLESPGFYTRRDDDHPDADPASSLESIKVAARAAAAAAKNSGALIGLSEEQLAIHLTRQLAELQRSESTSVAVTQVADEQRGQLNQTQSLPTSRHSSISPFSNASTGSTSGIWSVRQDSSPEDFAHPGDVFPSSDDPPTPRFSSILRHSSRSNVRLDSTVSSEDGAPPSTDELVETVKADAKYDLFHDESFAKHLAKALEL